MVRADRAARPQAMGSGHRPAQALLSVLVGSLFGCAAAAQSQPPAGSPTDVGYTPVTGWSHPLHPRQDGDRPADRRPAPDVARIVVESSANGLPADGQSVARLTVRLLDAQGRPARGTHTVTLEHSGGRLRLPGGRTDETGTHALDRDPATPGVQWPVADGIATFELVAPMEAQNVRLRVSVGREVAAGEISFVPDLRPMVAAGLLEGIVTLRHRTTVQPVRKGDAFEQEIEHWSRDFRDGRGTAAARAALFLKGTVRGDWLLTAAYDSDKATRARLLRDIQPDQMYPVYGDASLRSFDARSADRLYLRVDKRRSYLLYGDFVTGDGFTQALGQGAVASLKQRSLGATNRTATGLRAHHEADGLVANAYALRDSLRQVVEELSSQGSGPYGLRNNAVLEGSEKLEMVVRDRMQPSRIIAVRPLLRLVDYTFEPFSGRILLTQHLPSLDADLNPVSLRITYEVDQGGPAFWAGGADAQWRVAERLEIGGSVFTDRNPLAPYRLNSANAAWVLGPSSAVVLEAARSHSEVNTNPTNQRGGPAFSGRSGPISGQAWRLEWAHEAPGHSARAFVGRSDPSFDNPAAPLQGGRGEALVKGRLALTDGLDVLAQAQHSEDRRPEGGELTQADLGLRWQLGPRWTAEAGWRSRRETVGAQGNGLLFEPFGSTAGLTSSLASGSGGGALGFGQQPLDPATGLPLVQPGSTLGEAVNTLPVGTRLAADSLRLGLGWRANDALTLGAEIEHELDGTERRRLSLGADWRLANQARLYGRWERQQGWTTLQGVSAIQGRSSALVVGVDGQAWFDAQAYSEYRLRDAISGQDVQLASGLRRQWQLGAGLGLQAALERVQVVRGDSAAARSASLGLDWTGSSLWRGSTRLELRRSGDRASTPVQDEQFTTLLWTGLLARKIDRDWTGLARLHSLRTDYRSRGDVVQNRSQLGVAWRDTDTNRGNALAKVEFKHERDASQASVGTLRTRGVVAALAGEWHPSRPWWLQTRVAAKWQADRLEGGVDSRFNARWLSAQLQHDLGKRWDVGVGMSAQFGQHGARQTAAGAELGYLVAENLWLSAGYNVTGFRADAELSGYAYTQRGAYLRLRFKFDENLFAAADPRVNRSLPRPPAP
jgi:hypothetical protein